MTKPGQIVILNGAPRGGKSSIAAQIQDSFDGVWLNLGVDAWAAVTPARLRPGIGLRPGGERPDLEPDIMQLYAGLYEAVAANCRWGLNVVVDVGHHDAYSRPLGLLPDCARRLAGLPVLFVGVRCPIEQIMRRRNADATGRYVGGAPNHPPAPVLLWQREVHRPGVYDLEVDTGQFSPAECAAIIADRLSASPVSPTAFERLASFA